MVVLGAEVEGFVSWVALLRWRLGCRVYGEGGACQRMLLRGLENNILEINYPLSLMCPHHRTLVCHVPVLRQASKYLVTAGRFLLRQS